MSKQNTKNIIVALGLAVVLAANAFFFIPLTLYIGNIDSFITPVGSILFFYSLPALAVIAFIITIGGFIGERGYSRYISLIAAIGLLVWLQGNVLVWEYGLLDGQNIDWSLKKWRGGIDLFIWIGVITLVFVLGNSFTKPVVRLAFTVFTLQAFMATYSIYMNIDGLLEKEKPVNSPDLLKEISSFSPRVNVLHIILDGFQADIFEDIINNETEGEHYRNELEGFIFFREHMGVFPTTYMTAPAILSAEIYKNHMPKQDFIKKVYSGKTILNSSYKAGYEVDLVSEPNMLNMYANGQYTNSFVITDDFHMEQETSDLDDATKLFDLTLFRLVPHFLKKYIYNGQKWLVRPLILDLKYQQFRYFSHTAFLNNVSKNISLDRSQPVYKYFHLMNTHWPMVVNENCEYVGKALPRIRATVTAQAKCSLDAVIRLLNRMKELGIYKSSFIILMGDHGSYIPPLRFKPQFIMGKNTDFKVEPWAVALITPLMLIKEPDSFTRPLYVSTAPSSIVDTAATVNSIMNLGEKFNGRSMLDLEATEQRERKLYFYKWNRKDWVSKYTGPIQEYIIDGSIYDSQDWRQGSVYSPPNQ